ncbi:uncharacterized protein LOC141619872 [Silene latifolia]|uniref:uncharacterized protein LOC141619872 n=1 Tax=Silene latifolia TaxID=37657 RepID=UPI003D7804C2
MKISAWNVRGFNCPINSEVHTFLKDNNVDILALLETRVSSANATAIISQKFRDWVVVTNYSKHYNGRIWVLINPKSFRIVSQKISDQTNKQDSSTRVWSNLDRALVNPSWPSGFPQSFAHFSESGISDHSPIIVHITEDRKIQKRKDFAYISAKAKSAKIALIECQAKLGQNPFSASLIQEERLKLKEFITISERRHQQQIGILKDVHGVPQFGHNQVSQAFQDYYQGFFGQSSQVEPLSNRDYPGSRLSTEDSLNMAATVTLKEIKDSLFSMDINSSPGNDGFSAGFFKSAWAIIGMDFSRVVYHFFQTKHMAKQANSTVLSLIPKKAVPSSIMDYRPISCSTVFYKVISKILANRLQKVLPSLVGEERAAFVKGRSIFENVMLP